MNETNCITICITVATVGFFAMLAVFNFNCTAQNTAIMEKCVQHSKDPRDCDRLLAR